MAETILHTYKLLGRADAQAVAEAIDQAVLDFGADDYMYVCTADGGHVTGVELVEYKLSDGSMVRDLRLVIDQPSSTPVVVVAADLERHRVRWQAIARRHNWEGAFLDSGRALKVFVNSGGWFMRVDALVDSIYRGPKLKDEFVDPLGRPLPQGVEVR